MDDALAMELAATQHSLITQDQAPRSGSVATGSIQHRCRRRDPGSVRTSVCIGSPARPSSRHQRLLAACLAVGRPSAASHRAAAAVHGIWPVPDELIEITVGRDRSPELAGVTMHRLADLDERWIVRDRRGAGDHAGAHARRSRRGAPTRFRESRARSRDRSSAGESARCPGRDECSGEEGSGGRRRDPPAARRAVQRT